MPKFIVDTCADVVDGQKKYLALLFRDVRELNGYLVVVGGTRMNKEIRGKPSLLLVLNDLKRAGRLLQLDNKIIDDLENDIRARVNGRVGKIPPSCDDFHILAIALKASCKNVITKEQRLADCVEEIRQHIGHKYCPALRLIRTDQVYSDLKSKGRL